MTTDSDARRAVRRIRVPVAVDLAALGAGFVLFVLAAWQLAVGRIGDGAALAILATVISLAGAISEVRKRSARRTS